MKVIKKLSLVSSLALFATLSSVTYAESDVKGEVGIVTCEYIEGSKVNLLIHSSAAFECSFKHDDGVESYNGEAGIALGLDLQWNTKSTMKYSVLATADAEEDWATALNGTYTGGKASAALGVGIGAAVLIGGSNDSIGLVPLAIEGSEGVGASAGLGYLTLQSK